MGIIKKVIQALIISYNPTKNGIAYLRYLSEDSVSWQNAQKKFFSAQFSSPSYSRQT